MHNIMLQEHIATMLQEHIKNAQCSESISKYAPGAVYIEIKLLAHIQLRILPQIIHVLPILLVIEWDFELEVSKCCTNVSLNCLFVIIIVSTFFLSCGQDNLLSKQFWAMGRFYFLGG